MNNHTPAQLKAIQTWTDQRDALLKEIGTLSIDRDVIAKGNTESAAALTDVNLRIAEARGRLSVLDELEAARKNSLSIEVSELEARKSRLEGECVAKEEALKVLGMRQEETVSNIGTLVLMHDKMHDQATIVDQVVGQVIEISKTAISEIGTTMGEIRTVALEVIDKGNENVKQTSIVLEKLPKYIFELQRPIPVRRHYPVGHPYAQPADTEIPADTTQS